MRLSAKSALSSSVRDSVLVTEHEHARLTRFGRRHVAAPVEDATRDSDPRVAVGGDQTASASRPPGRRRGASRGAPRLDPASACSRPAQTPSTESSSSSICSASRTRCATFVSPSSRCAESDLDHDGAEVARDHAAALADDRRHGVADVALASCELEHHLALPWRERPHEPLGDGGHDLLPVLARGSQPPAMSAKFASRSRRRPPDPSTRCIFTFAVAGPRGWVSDATIGRRAGDDGYLMPPC